MDKILKKEFLAPIITVIICLILIVVSKKLINKIFKYRAKKTDDARKKTIINLISNIVKFIIVLLGILTILEVYGIDTKSLVASFGVVGLVLGLALQDIIKDFLVGIAIVFEGQYSLGDWVSINGFKGEVIPSNLRTTKLKAYTGEIRIISNRNIGEITNYSQSNSNLVIDVDVAYESDIERVKKVLDTLCDSIKEKFNLQSVDCLGIQELSASSIRFRLFIITKYLDMFTIDREIKRQIVLEFRKNNIVIPYNQVVVHNG